MIANDVWLLRWSAALLAVLCCCAPLHADGKYFGKSSAAFTNDPAMPSQAAVMARHDGVETLIIESGVESTGEAVAWLTPVPSAPTSIKSASRGTVMSALDLVGPNVYARERTLRTVRDMVIPLTIALCVGLLVRTAIVNQVKWLVIVAAVGGPFWNVLHDPHPWMTTWAIQAMEPAVLIDRTPAWMGQGRRIRHPLLAPLAATALRHTIAWHSGRRDAARRHDVRPHAP